MPTRLTLFRATLVQDSALSVSGLDRESTADQPFTLVGGVPTLVGRGLKGAAVAMAKRFFEFLPRAVSDDPTNGALRRSAWEFADATAIGSPRMRAGVGIRHKTGARADGVLYSREVIPAGTRWQLELRVDRSYALDDAEFTEAEGILGYVLAAHWAKGRCWLGGGAARGLGWCHLEDLEAYRLDDTHYDVWVTSGRLTLPAALDAVPVVEPTRSWCFRTLDVDISFGEYKPEPDEAAWGLDMFAVGTHDLEGGTQSTGSGTWARPAWATDADTPVELSTDRPLLMEAERPLLPGASVRGPLRHAYSRAQRAAGHCVMDPHVVQGNVGDRDLGGSAFGTVRTSSRILIRDARAEEDWAAAKLHMHAEDEFSAGSYGKSKRNAVRLLRGVFPVRIIIEGPDADAVEPLVRLIDRQVELGALGHLPVGGHKTRGAGWGRWSAKPWSIDDVTKTRNWHPSREPDPPSSTSSDVPPASLERAPATNARVTWRTEIVAAPLTLGEAAKLARVALGDRPLVAWWCDPTNDLDVTSAPVTFGRDWPDADDKLQVDEVAFYSTRAVWRAARTANGSRSVFIEEKEDGAEEVRVVHTPAHLHRARSRFSSADIGAGTVLLREWHADHGILGFTLTQEQR